MADLSTVGANVRALRRAAGHMHQGAFAQRAKVSQQWLSDLETGRILTPTAENLIRIAIAIPCAVDDLLAGIDPDFDATRRKAASERVLVSAAADLTLSDLITGRNMQALVKACRTLTDPQIRPLVAQAEVLSTLVAEVRKRTARVLGSETGPRPAARGTAGKGRRPRS